MVAASTGTLKRRWMHALMLVSALVLLGCVNQNAADSNQSVQIPTTAEGMAAQWLLVQLNADAELESEELSSSFATTSVNTPTGIDQIYALESYRRLGPWRVTHFEDFGQYASVVFKDTADREIEVEFTLEDEAAEPVFTTMLVHPAVSNYDHRAGSLTEIERAVLALPEHTTLLLTRLDETEAPAAILDVNATRMQAMGSAAGVYALVYLSAQDSVPWEQKVLVTDLQRKLNTGLMTRADAEPNYTLEQILARYLYSADSASADLLHAYSGRNNIQTAVTDSDHRDPALLEPFLAQWERTYVAQTDEASEYSTMSPDNKGWFLATLTLAGAADMSAQLSESVWDTGLDWPASGYDISSAYQQIITAAQPSDEVWQRAWNRNPGVLQARLDWEHSHVLVGRAPGVYTVFWLVSDSDGATYLITVQHQSENAVSAQTQQSIYNLAYDATRVLADGSW